MGFLTEGNTLDWEASKPYRKMVKKHGLVQFLNLYNSMKDREPDVFRWGDEVEYILVNIPTDPEEPATLSLTSEALLKKGTSLAMQKNADIRLLPEFGSFMIEATPGSPYEDYSTDLLKVEQSMRDRRTILEEVLPENVYLFSIGNFPMMGTDSYLPKEMPKEMQATHGEFADSEYISDSVINPHPRFGTLVSNIRTRRGSKVDIRIPKFQDKKTVGDEIHMDAMGFGMGCCCLQVTFQAWNLFEARCLYDQLATLTPVFMALGASTPFYKGQISDIDCRWTVIAQSVDDRTPGERGKADLAEGELRIPKSRYDTIDTYICECQKRLDSGYNDIDLVIDQEAYEFLVAGGVDDRLAKHLAHLWIRDPLVIYDNRLDVDDTKTMEHFENIQSTNWQNVRFKPPPFNSNIGWRVEFRTMEIQLTDFENAAFVNFITLLNRAILHLKLNLYIKLTEVDINMQRAHARNAYLEQKFFFKHPKLPGDPENFEPKVEEMTIREIFLGKGDRIGLVAIVRTYLDDIGLRGPGRHCVERYLTFMEKRATGEYPTTAQWMREFVTNHHDYKNDSNLTPTIVRDLLIQCDKIAHSSIDIRYDSKNRACSKCAPEKFEDSAVPLIGSSESNAREEEVDAAPPVES